MINDLKWKLNKAPEPRYSVSERVLFIGGGVMFWLVNGYALARLIAG